MCQGLKETWGPRSRFSRILGPLPTGPSRFPSQLIATGICRVVFSKTAILYGIRRGTPRSLVTPSLILRQDLHRYFLEKRKILVDTPILEKNPRGHPTPGLAPPRASFSPKTSEIGLSSVLFSGSRYFFKKHAKILREKKGKLKFQKKQKKTHFH